MRNEGKRNEYCWNANARYEKGEEVNAESSPKLSREQRVPRPLPCGLGFRYAEEEIVQYRVIRNYVVEMIYHRMLIVNRRVNL